MPEYKNVKRWAQIRGAEDGMQVRYSVTDAGTVKRRELPAHNKAAGMTNIPNGFLYPPVPHKHLSGAFQAIVA